MWEEISKTLSKFSNQTLSPAVDELDREPPKEELRQSLFKEVAEIGTLSLPLPESLGGIGGDPKLVSQVLEKISESCAGVATSLWAHYGAILPFLTAHSYDHDSLNKLSKSLQGLPRGDTCGIGYLNETPLNITHSGDKLDLSGEIKFAWGAPRCKKIMISGEAAGEIVFLLLDLEVAGLSIGELHRRIGLRCCQSTSLDLIRVSVPREAALVIEESAGQRLLATARATLLGWVGAMAVGNARGALNKAWDYVKERYQGGDILINHSLIQIMLGQMVMQLKASESLVDRSFNLSANGQFLEAAGLAKVFATKVGEQICSDAVQCHGGYGYMREYGVEKHLRDAKALSVISGNNNFILRNIIHNQKEKEGWS